MRTWPGELRDARREEVDAAPERAVQAAKAAGADGLLVPGDLWDAESAPAASIHRLLEALASFAPRLVFVAPGNHDFAGPAGWYDPALLSALGMRAWPENVVVFRDPGFSTRPFPGRDDTAIVGRAYLSREVLEERPLGGVVPRPEVPLSILLLHGSYESYAGPDAPAGGKRTAPFSRQEILDAGFTWTALGHHHRTQVVEDDAGRPIAAYAGSPTGRGFDETGPRFFLKVTLEAGAPAVVERIPADERVIHDLTLDAEGRDAAALLAAARALLSEAGASEKDVVRLTVSGRQVYGSRVPAALASLATSFTRFLVRDRTSVFREDEAIGLRTAEGRFVADLLARRERAENEETRRVVDLALALGRDALAGRALVPPEPEEL